VATVLQLPDRRRRVNNRSVPRVRNAVGARLRSQIPPLGDPIPVISGPHGLIGTAMPSAPCRIIAHPATIPPREVEAFTNRLQVGDTQFGTSWQSIACYSRRRSSAWDAERSSSRSPSSGPPASLHPHSSPVSRTSTGACVQRACTSRPTCLIAFTQVPRICTRKYDQIGRSLSKPTSRRCD
jgi:hypothetical protein